MITKAQVLFVDDDRETAQAYADLVAKQTGLITAACSTRAEAAALINSNPIAVAVLDQKMPEISGTELYRHLVELKPGLKAVMLSGEANRNDVSQALGLGYVADVFKSNLEPLAREVFKAYARYLKDTSTTIDPPSFLGRRGLGLPYFPKIEYHLRSIELLSPPEIPEAEWRLLDQINAGQKKEIETVNRETREVIIESTFDASASGSTELELVGIAKLRGRIASEIRSRFLGRSTETVEVERRIKETISLPDEPVDPHQIAVKWRGFYTGAEIVRVRLGVAKRYKPFRDESVIWVEVSAPTGRVGTKQVDILTDGSKIERVTHLE